jgi:anti-anti-sigma regulatory factor
VVITPEEIDITNADGLRGALLRASAQGRGTYVVDMTRNSSSGRRSASE